MERTWDYDKPEIEQIGDQVGRRWRLEVGMVSTVPGRPPPPVSATRWFWTRRGAERAYRRLVAGKALVFYGF